MPGSVLSLVLHKGSSINVLETPEPYHKARLHLPQAAATDSNIATTDEMSRDA